MKLEQFFKKEDCMNNSIYMDEPVDQWFFSKNDMMLFAKRYHTMKLSERQTPTEPNNNPETKQLIIGDVSGSAFLTRLLSEIKQHEREIISDPHRFTGISTAELERVFDKHGVKMKIPF
jgi:hypothetical protein